MTVRPRFFADKCDIGFLLWKKKLEQIFDRCDNDFFGRGEMLWFALAPISLMERLMDWSGLEIITKETAVS